MVLSDEVGLPLFNEWPYAYVLHENKASSYCHYCLKSKWSNQAELITCSRCHFASYCDQECQLLAHDDHKEECKCMERCEGFIPSRKARIIARMIFKMNENYVPDSHLPESLQKRRFSDLMNHKEEIISDSRRTKEFRNICNELDEYLFPEHWVGDEVLLDIYGKVTVNSFSILIREISIALGLYIGTSILDHSCDPDVFATFNGPRIIIRPFKPGVERKPLKDLRIGYFGTFVATRERQTLSSSRYYFNCDCALCKDKIRDLEMHSIRCEHCSGVAIFDEKADADSTAICQTCKKTTDGTKAKALMKEMEIVLEQLGANPDAVKEWHNLKSIPEDLKALDEQSRLLLSEINVYSCSLSVKLQGMCNVAKLSAEAYDYCLRALKAPQHFLHVNHPLRLLQTKSAGIVKTENPSTVEEGIELLKEAEKGYRFVGDDARAQECRSVVNAIQEDMINIENNNSTK
uniref:MYND-type domain-containing protein n=1 Tax=Plectus sambesii TaxID=2011161 RepID=A0A914V3Z7_9BILA